MDVGSDHLRAADSAIEEPTLFFRPKPDGVADPVGEAGWYLQRERERRGETLDMVGEVTGIHPYHLQAIETGDLTCLPERLEALEMIGIYGQYMGFEPEPLILHYAGFLPARPIAPGKSHPANPAPLSSAKILKFGRMPSFPRLNIHSFPGGAGGIIASCLAAIVLFAGTSWMMLPASEMPMTQVVQSGDPMPTASTDGGPEATISEEPMPDAQPIPAIEPPAIEPPAETKAPESEEGLSGLTDFIEETLEGEGSAVEPAAKPAKNPPAAEPQPQATLVEPKISRLVLKAKAPVWVRIEDVRGNVVMTQMLRAGDVYSVPDREGLVVIARDGGLLSYIIDGKERGILGTPGEILVGQPLDIRILEEKG